MLTSGGVAIGTGTGNLFILIDAELTRSEATVTAWHEILHMLREAGGATAQDEVEIETIAQRLAVCCPEVLTLCGLDKHFPEMVAASRIELPRLTASEAGPSAIPGKPRGENQS